jgi:hypothetical protein
VKDRRDIRDKTRGRDTEGRKRKGRLSGKKNVPFIHVEQEARELVLSV